MNILNNLSTKDLKLNKKRSLVIIIGIILSTALICGVAGIITSFQNSILEYYKENDGNYHAVFYEVPKEELKYIEENRNVKEYYLSEELGYAKLEGSQNKNKPYVNVISMNNGYLNNMGIRLSEGRMPENENEILISKHMISNGKVEYKIGETITLEIGQRQLTTGEKLDQNNPYLTGEPDEQGKILQEEIVNTTKREYKIVGIIERPSMQLEDYMAPGYTVITKMENIQKNANIAVLYTKVSKYQEYTEQINEMEKAVTDEEKDNATRFNGLRNAKYKSYKYELSVNYDLLAFEGVNLSDNMMSTIYSVGGVIMAIVLVSSVFVIRNGFAISITERLKQYGMLSSIGATKKQIKKSVYFEGFILGIIGIPLGILSGIFAIDILLKIVNLILSDFVTNVKLMYSISWFAIAISVAISIITIWLSCRSSARKASKVTPIEAIRNSEDIKLKAKKIKCPKIIKRIFKTGGEIAYKNLKRSKKKYRTTVVSIIVSIVIFIAISSFIDYGFKMTANYYTERGYNISINDMSQNSTSIKAIQKERYERYLEVAKLDGISEYSIKRHISMEVNSENYLSEFGKKVKENTGKTYVLDENGEEQEAKDYLMIMSLGKEEYERYVKKIGGKYEDYKNGAILIDNCMMYDEEGKRTTGNFYTWKKGDTITGEITEIQDTNEPATDHIVEIKDTHISSIENKDKKEEPKKIKKSLEIVDKSDIRPMGLEEMYSNNKYLIVSDEYMDQLGIFYDGTMEINAEDSYKVEDEINQFYKSKNISESNVIVSNIDEFTKEQNSIVLVVSIFLYGFITVISLIGITNIFNTITTNMNLRKKEFAMLKSVGMTKKEFNRMIRLESIFYGLKSLIFGIPIGIALSYGIFKMFNSNAGSEFIFPLNSILISIVFVAVIISIIMKYSMSKINKQNIIETIRNDNI